MHSKSKFIGKVVLIFSNVMIVLFAALSILVCRSITWMFRTWQHLTMEELMFQLQSPIEGTNSEIIYDYIYACLLAALAVLLFVTGVLYVFRNRKKLYYIISVVIVGISTVMLAWYVYMAFDKLEVKAYMENSNTYSSFIDKNYVDPNETVLTFPEKKRNLIYIFLESTEITFADKANGGAFDQNVIPELTQIAQEGECFAGSEALLNGGKAMYGTTWTAGAIFGHTTGIPLNVPIDGNAMSTQTSFLPGVTSIGDILAGEGYKQVFMIGSDAAFGGRDLYFKGHGDYEIFDYNYFRDIGKFPADYKVWWGFEDAKLFEYAKEKLTELGSGDQPFNFTMLTVDTHFEDGYKCEFCGNEYGDNVYSDVYACASRQVSEFVRWIQSQEFYENTTIVLVGDHCTMDSDYCAEIGQDYSRRVYTSYINSAAELKNPEWRREYSTFDNFPTTLASLGVEIEGDRLGLGVNLFSNRYSLLEMYGEEMFQEELQKRSELLDNLTSYIEVPES